MIDNSEQHSLGWYRARHGKITGSCVGLLMESGRNDCFSQTGKSYIYKVAGERGMNPAIVNDDELFGEYIQQVNVTSKAMRWGTDQEASARALYEKMTGRHIVEVGSCKHPAVPNFASSPDGYFYDENTGEKLCLEIKCPNQATFMRYKCEIHDNDSLLSVKYEYFYQCMAHMVCTDSQAVDFVVYNPFQSVPIHIVRITPDEKVFMEMEKRIRMADDIINELSRRSNKTRY